MRSVFLAAASVVLVFGCGSGGASSADAGPAPSADGASPPIDDAAAPPPAIDASTPSDSPSTADAGTFPAFRPTIPTIASGGGAVLTAATIVPIFFPQTDFTTSLTDYLGKAVTSAEWTAQTTEYGVGAPSVVTGVPSAALPSATITQADLETFIAQQVGAGAWGARDTGTYGTRVYLLFLPAAVTVSLPNGKSTCNGGPTGYHNEVLVGTTHVPYAIAANCGKGIDQVTRVAWHELAEACTDPYAAPNRAFFKVDPAWATAFTGGEVGDMCEHRGDVTIRPADVGYAVPRIWSNAAARAYHDPCVPAPTSPYAAAAPVLPDMVTLGTATVAGVKIPVGASRTIDVQLFSDGPTSGPFEVSAVESKGGTTLSFTWDKTDGLNGDVLHLTITATSAAPAGTTFEISTLLGTSSSQFVGAVAND